MYRNQPVALLAAGKISESVLRRWPGLAGQIGLVWATHPGLATKFARALRIGARGEPADDLRDYPFWILHGPGAPPSLLLNLALATGLPLQGRILAVLDDRAGSEQFHLLEEMGASVATFWSAGSQEAGFPLLVEGSGEAIRGLRAVLRRAGFTSLRLQAGTKQFYTAANLLAQGLSIPLIDGIARCLESTGLSRPMAQRVALHWAELQARAYAASGRKGWPDPARGGRQGQVERGLEQLRDRDRHLAAGLGRALEVCRALMKPSAPSGKAAASKE